MGKSKSKRHDVARQARAAQRKTTSKATRRKEKRAPASEPPPKPKRRASKAPEELLGHPNEQLSTSWACPPGYVILEKGDKYLTLNCRKLASEAGETIFVVHDEGKCVRKGLKVPEDIFTRVQEQANDTAKDRQWYGLLRDRRRTAVARAAIYEAFPCIPTKSAEGILSHGFLKGSGRVGRSTTLEAKEKIMLATAAHIRHHETDYDTLIREHQRAAAVVSGQPPKLSPNDKARFRKQIQGQIKATLELWRGNAVEQDAVVETRSTRTGNHQSKHLKTESRPVKKQPTRGAAHERPEKTGRKAGSGTEAKTKTKQKNYKDLSREEKREINLLKRTRKRAKKILREGRIKEALEMYETANPLGRAPPLIDLVDLSTDVDEAEVPTDKPEIAVAPTKKTQIVDMLSLSDSDDEPILPRRKPRKGSRKALVPDEDEDDGPWEPGDDVVTQSGHTGKRRHSERRSHDGDSKDIVHGTALHLSGFDDIEDLENQAYWLSDSDVDD